MVVSDSAISEMSSVLQMSSSSSDETHEDYALSVNEPSLSKESSPSSSLGDCAVCSQPAHGLHFGVLSCRACAAFYRRSVVLNKQYTCRRANRNCSINKEERYLCRLCRFEKCIRVGMQADNVQWNREKTAERIKAFNAPNSFPADLASSSKIQPQATPKELFSEVHFSQSRPSPEEMCLSGLGDLLIDIRPIVHRVTAIFENPPLPPQIGLKTTLIQRMLAGLHHLRRNQSMCPEIVSFADAVRFRDAWEQQLYAIAQWAMHIDEFVAIPPDQKLAIYKASWGAFHRLERFHMTVSIYGTSLLDKWASNSLIVVVANDFAIDFYNTDFDFSFITDYDQESVKGMFRPFVIRLFEEVAKPMIELQVTDTELVFMLGQLTWHLEGRRVSPETQSISESFRNQISNELHDYYMYHLTITNYASRLVRLMRIVNDVENIVYERNKVLELARIFDVFKIKITDPDMISSSRMPDTSRKLDQLRL